MYRLTVILLSAIFLFVSFIGPFFHVHWLWQYDHNADGLQTRATVIHTHLTIHLEPSASGDQRTIIAADEGGTGSQVSLYVFEQKVSVLMPFLPQRGFVAETAKRLSVFSPAPEPQAHDPPPPTPHDGRAPPA